MRRSRLIVLSGQYRLRISLMIRIFSIFATRKVSFRVCLQILYIYGRRQFSFIPCCHLISPQSSPVPFVGSPRRRIPIDNAARQWRNIHYYFSFVLRLTTVVSSALKKIRIIAGWKFDSVAFRKNARPERRLNRNSATISTLWTAAESIIDSD